MKSMMLKGALLLTISAINTVAIADNTGNTYVGVSYGLGTYNEDGVEELNPTGLMGKYGKYMSDGFSLEGRFGIGLQDDSVNLLGVDVSLDFDTLFGVYGVGHVNVNKSSSVYGLIGFTRAEATVSAPGFGSETDDESGVSYGVGANIGVGDNVALNIEYIQYLNKSDFDFSTIGFGVVFNH